MQQQREVLEEKEKDRHALRLELEDARQMQMSLLPESPPRIDGLQLIGKSIPANEVSGDFLDYLVYDDPSKVTVAVGDVSGKFAVVNHMEVGRFCLKTRYSVIPSTPWGFCRTGG